MGTHFIDILRASKGGYAWAGPEIAPMLGLKQVGTGMLETGRGSGGTGREWTGRSKVGYGLWAMGNG